MSGGVVLEEIGTSQEKNTPKERKGTISKKSLKKQLKYGTYQEQDHFSNSSGHNFFEGFMCHKINDYLWCEQCGVSHKKDCPKYGKLARIKDKSIPSRAKLTTPHQLSVRIVELRAGNKHVYGVFAKKIIQKRTKLGPYEGTQTDTWCCSDGDNRIKLKIFHDDGSSHFLDCTDHTSCNWMMYVRPATKLDEQNAVAFQYLGVIYFVTTKVLAVNDELKVWYAKEYAAALGEDLLKEPEQPPASPPSPSTIFTIDKEFLTPPKAKVKFADDTFQSGTAVTDKLEALASIALKPDPNSNMLVSEMGSTFYIQEDTSNKFSNTKINASINADGQFIMDIPVVCSNQSNSSSQNDGSLSGNTDSQVVNVNTEILQIIDPNAFQQNVEVNKTLMTIDGSVQEIGPSYQVNTSENNFEDITNELIIDTGSPASTDGEDNVECSFDDSIVDDASGKDVTVMNVTNIAKDSKCPSCFMLCSTEEIKSHICNVQVDLPLDNNRMTDVASVNVQKHVNVNNRKRKGHQSEGTNIKAGVKSDQETVNSSKKQSLIRNSKCKKEEESKQSFDNVKIRRRKPLSNQIRRVQPEPVRDDNGKVVKKPKLGTKPLIEEGQRSRRTKRNILNTNGKISAKLKKRKDQSFLRKKVERKQPSKDVLTCQQCDKAFQNKNKLLIHMYQHTGERPFKCTFEGCSKAFVTAFKLKRHITTHGIGSKFDCPYCEKTFGRKDHLKNHLRIHDPNKTLYSCQMCEKLYTSPYAFRTHLAFHKAEQGDLTCFVCKEELPDKEQLLFHLKVHSGARSVKNATDKKHVCNNCGKAFFTVKDVRRHSVVHTKERPHMCHLCPQRFGRRDHLVRHIKKAHADSSDVGQNNGHDEIPVTEITKMPSPSVPNPIQTLSTSTKKKTRNRKKKQNSEKKNAPLIAISKASPNKLTQQSLNLQSQPTVILPGNNEEISLPLQEALISAIESSPVKSAKEVALQQPPPLSGNEVGVISTQGNTDITQTTIPNVTPYVPFVIQPQGKVEGMKNSNFILDGLNAQISLQSLQNQIAGNLATSVVPSIQGGINTSVALNSFINSLSTMSVSNQVPVCSPAIQPALNNVQDLYTTPTTGDQNVTPCFNIVNISQASPAFPETNLSDISRILDGTVKSVVPVNTANPSKKNKTPQKTPTKRKPKRQKSKTTQSSLSKEATVLVKDLPILQSVQPGTAQENQVVSTLAQSIPSNAVLNVLSQDQLTNNSSFQIPGFGSNFDSISFNFGSAIASEKAKNIVTKNIDKTISIGSSSNSLLTNQELLQSLITPVQQQPQPQVQQQVNQTTGQQSFTILSLNNEGAANTVYANPQNIQFLQLVNANELGSQGQIFLSPEKITPVQSLSSNQQTSVTQQNVSQSLSSGIITVDTFNQPQSTTQNYPIQLAPYDSDALKIFFSDEQQQH